MVKVGDTVTVQRTGRITYCYPSGYFDLLCEDGYVLEATPEYIVTPTEPRKPWDVVREAAEICKDQQWHINCTLLRNIADQLEAAARPKPQPTLAEAVRAYLDAPHDITRQGAMAEALAREEAAARGEA